MGHAFEIVQNDLLPVLSGQAQIRDTGDPLPDVASASLRFIMRASGAAVTINSTAIATITSATEARLAAVWASGHTATSGYFEGKFELTYPGPQRRTVPARGFIGVYVEPDIG